MSARNATCAVECAAYLYGQCHGSSRFVPYDGTGTSTNTVVKTHQTVTEQHAQILGHPPLPPTWATDYATGDAHQWESMTKSPFKQSSSVMHTHNSNANAWKTPQRERLHSPPGPRTQWYPDSMSAKSGYFSLSTLSRSTNELLQSAPARGYTCWRSQWWKRQTVKVPPWGLALQCDTTWVKGFA